MPKCDLYDDQGRTQHPARCPFDAQYVAHLPSGGKDWYLCKKHYSQMKREGALNKLIRLGRVEKL